MCPTPCWVTLRPRDPGYLGAMSYTIRNLRDIKDVAPQFGFDSIQEAHFGRNELEAEDTGLAFHVIKPGRHGGAHRHEAAEEICVVLAGSGQVSLDGEVSEIGALDAIRIAPKVARAFAAGPEGLEFIVFGPHHEKDGELLDEDPWAD